MSQFSGMRVLELASVLAGPSVGQFFAELGADVIKVENVKTGGDVTRTWKSAHENTDDRSAYFCSVNWGKRSIAIDLAIPQGQEIVQELALRSQVVIASFKPGDAEKLRVDYSTLSRFNRGLIYGQVTGYGPDNQRVGYDAIIQAEAGFMSMNGFPEGESLKMPVALMDVLTAHHLKEGLLLALLEKTISGKGKLVEVSLIEAAIASLANQGSNWLVAKELPQKQGSSHPNISPYGDTFTTADDYEILLAVGTDAQFRALCLSLGNEGLADDPRFKDNPMRVKNRAELKIELQSLFSRIQGPNCMARLHHARVPAGRIQTVREAVEGDGSRNILLQSNELSGLRSFVGHPLPSVSHLLPPPHFGAHTRSILTEILNFSPEDLDLLRNNRVIA